MSVVAPLGSVELCVTDGIKKGVDCNWIRSAACVMPHLWSPLWVVSKHELSVRGLPPLRLTQNKKCE
jgi:hypothetical protein